MRSRLILLLLHFFGTTPLRFNQKLGGWLGLLIWKFDKRSRGVTLRNMQLCFPNLTATEQHSLGKNSCVEMGRTILESPSLWKLPQEKIQAMLENPSVLEEILERYRQGNGLVIATPHLGSWEYVGLLIGPYIEMTNLYRPPRIEALNDWLQKARSSSGAKLVPTDASGVRALTKVLAQGHCTGILPDQEPETGSGVFSPFYSQHAYTMSLLPRLVRKRKTPVGFIFAERLSSGMFRLHCDWADEALYYKDPEVACTHMNAQIESLISKCPEQYNWAYKRFRKQPEGLDNPYSRDVLESLV